MDAIEKITEIRRRNNDCWMTLLRIALKHAPLETKTVLASISMNDSEITALLKQVARED